ncbi:MAG TPA: type II secretion system protein GspM [Nevskiaceae bacterium]|nr:type II secretion system protein GspM [Nevskiaceae bacterium]
MTTLALPEAWLAPLRARWAPLYERYRALQPQERKLVLAAAIVIAIALIYLIVWEPVADARHANRAALEAARATAAQIESLAPLATHASDTHHVVTRNGASLLTTVDLASRGVSGLSAPSRLQPDGTNKVRIWFEHVSFKALTGWIRSLQAQHGIVVTDADITRDKAAGTVDARFSLRGPT